MEFVPALGHAARSRANAPALWRKRIQSGGKALSIEEKPQVLKSHYTVTGPYFGDGEVCAIAASLLLSA